MNRLIEDCCEVAALCKLCGFVPFMTALMSLLLAQCVATADPVASYTYSLERAGQVSAAVYNSDGRLIRTLLRGEKQNAGENTVYWDGLNRHGEPQPAGRYTVKILRTPGFRAEFITQLGVNPDSAPYHKWVGNHGGPSSVAVDATGMYTAAEITETAPVLLKQSLNGTERLWTQGRGGVTHGRFQGGSALASDNEGMLYMLQQNGRLQPINAGSGKVQVNKYSRDGAWDPLPESVKNSIDHRKEVRQRYHHDEGEIAGADIAAHGSTLVISFREQDSVRWLSTEDGSLKADLEVPSPLGVAVSPQEAVYVISERRVLQVDTSGNEKPVITDNLTAPRRMSIAPRSGEFYIAEGPPSHRIKRFSEDGTLQQTYGRNGGRREGPYEPTDFLGVTDITATGGPQHGFIIAEPYVGPRRVAHFGRDGVLINEW